MDFSIERQVEADGTVRLILSGELDLAVRESLRRALAAEHLAGTSVTVVLDQLDYLDSTGIAELLQASRHARETGRQFAVTAGNGNVRHVLSISGTLSDLASGPHGDAVCNRTTDPASRGLTSQRLSTRRGDSAAERPARDGAWS